MRSVPGSAAPNSGSQYYGKLIGTLQEYAHKIRGTAYAVDESTIFIKGFSYDGTGPGECRPMWRSADSSADSSADTDSVSDNI
jgi:hypothetical protein